MIFWFNLPLHYFFSRLRSVLFQMSPTEISSYLSTNILAIGISSITPMIYLSLDTIKCVSNTDHSQNVYDQCAGVLLPQQSICVFLLIMMVAKVVIAPLSTSTITANDLIKLNLPHRTIFQGALSGLSFLLNFYLFANMEEGKASNSIWYIIFAAVILTATPLFLELFHMIFHRGAHRTSRTSTLSPATSEIFLSPVDSISQNPTDGGATDAFV
jgi:hypothetical protein